MPLRRSLAGDALKISLLRARQAEEEDDAIYIAAIFHMAMSFACRRCLEALLPRHLFEVALLFAVISFHVCRASPLRFRQFYTQFLSSCFYKIYFIFPY